MVRRDFLPRGEGCVTRRPIVLTLRNDTDAGDDEVVTFLEDNGSNDNFSMVSPDWSEVKREIEERTRIRAGRGTKSAQCSKVIIIVIIDPYGLYII